ncbi:hypothetical protein K504DRAFT_505799 [Pleomassaria siparia CBS 279.74]|uniref:Uncharacterized protein n=1 Tax=Pleomassaria siparia CBS 279.74 TaxID=1314801 RepID=A0A6G1K0U6_9PLEO|nr:hypothetical protein K504DRAFT_505799 [Pleomassaria siparia CBS 279.74]
MSKRKATATADELHTNNTNNMSDAKRAKKSPRTPKGNSFLYGYTIQQKAAILQFMNFTQVDRNTAIRHLKGHGWNQENAVNGIPRIASSGLDGTGPGLGTRDTTNKRRISDHGYTTGKLGKLGILQLGLAGGEALASWITHALVYKMDSGHKARSSDISVSSATSSQLNGGHSCTHGRVLPETQQYRTTNQPTCGTHGSRS